jgi:hypothetical protein
MGFWSDGAGARTAQTHHEGVRANEELRQANRFEVQERGQAFSTAMQKFKHAQKLEADWLRDNRAQKLKEYDRECRAADKAGRESKYASFEDVPDLPDRPDVPPEPVVEIPVREPVKLPMGLGTFAIIVAAILIGWAFIGDFVVWAYIVGVFAVPAAWIAWILIFFKKKNDAAGDPDRLAALERWNPLTIAARICLWCIKGCWKLIKLGLK